MFVIFKDIILRPSQRLEDVQSSLLTSGLHVRFFPDDEVLLASSVCDLHHSGGFASECEVEGQHLMVNVRK